MEPFIASYKHVGVTSFDPRSRLAWEDTKKARKESNGFLTTLPETNIAHENPNLSW